MIGFREADLTVLNFEIGVATRDIRFVSQFNIEAPSQNGTFLQTEQIDLPASSLKDQSKNQSRNQFRNQFLHTTSSHWNVPCPDR